MLSSLIQYIVVCELLFCHVTVNTSSASPEPSFVEKLHLNLILKVNR